MEVFHNPILNEREQFADKHGSKHNAVPKHIFSKQHGEPKGKFVQFAENVQ